jgi:hypothetical protein
MGLAVLIALVSLNQLRQAPSVQAASILRKAVAVSVSKSRPVHRIRVRTSHQQEFTRLSEAQSVVLQVAAMQTVAGLFQSAHYDWNDPLSARAFEQWRDEQVHKTDEVSETPSEHQTRIRTVSTEGTLEAASITFDTEDYIPVEERLEFRDGQWVELDQIAESSTESAGGTVGRPAGIPMRSAEPPSRPDAYTPGSPASISDELQVLSALNDIGADLGGQVEVALSGDKVMVTGSEGISPQRQDKIRSAVANLPRVAVEFTPESPVSLPPGATAARATAVSTPSSPFASRLEKQLGGHAEFDRVSNQVLDLDEAAMERMYALHRLAEKFPSSVEEQLNTQDLNVLHELSRKHTAVLAEKVSEMERLLVPMLSSLGGTAGSVPSAGHSSWQPASDGVYSSARRVEVLISQFLGMTPGKIATVSLPSDLLTAMRDLDANLADCQKLLNR